MRRTLDRWTFTSSPVGPPAAPPPYTVRPYDLEDAGEAFRLFQACFLQQRERAEWAWKFERMLTNPQPPFHVVEAGGQLVGMYPVRTLRLQVGDRVRLAPQCQDVCIDPAHRGGRIIRALLRANEEAWKAADVPLIFGFPTAEHMKVGARLLGYLDLFHLQVWSRRLARGLRLQARLPFDWARRLAY